MEAGDGEIAMMSVDVLTDIWVTNASVSIFFLC